MTSDTHHTNTTNTKLNKDINLYSVKCSNGITYLLKYLLDQVANAVVFMDLVLNTEQLFYRAHTRKISAIGKHLEAIGRYVDTYCDTYEYNPVLAFFYDQFRKHPIKNYRFDMSVWNPDCVDCFEDFVKTMRLNARSLRIKKHRRDWESKLVKNAKRIRQFLDELFTRYARVVVVRTDFNYHKATITPQELEHFLAAEMMSKQEQQDAFFDGVEINQTSSTKGVISFEEVQADRARLVRNMKGKPSIFKHLVGYIWRIECSRISGYHLHMTFFFDGSHVQKDAYLGDLIGQYWIDTITQGRGYYENCNRNKSRYGHALALGRIDYTDTDKRRLLFDALSYFCKASQVVQMVPYKNCRTFQCAFHRVRSAKIGRPRASSS